MYGVILTLLVPNKLYIIYTNLALTHLNDHNYYSEIYNYLTSASQ